MSCPYPQIKFDILDAITDEELDNELAFNVEIKDINDNAPQFSRNLMKADVKESSPEGVFLSVTHQKISLV